MEDWTEKHGAMLARVYDIVEDINLNRKQSQRLIVGDPGEKYCRVTTVTGAVYWWVDLTCGAILPPGDGLVPGTLKVPLPLVLEFNIMHESARDRFNHLGLLVVNGERQTAVMPDSGLGIYKWSDGLKKWPPQKLTKYDCTYPEKVYTNYALEA